MAEIEFKPRIKPRDISDIFYIVFMTMFIAPITVFVSALILVGGIPIASFFFSSHMQIGYGVYMACVMAILCIAPALCVQSIKISDEGIRFTRIFGYPKFLKWSQIKQIVKNIPRKEIRLDGLRYRRLFGVIDPPYLTSLGHYKIEWSNGYSYFPPREPDKFENIVKKYIQIKDMTHV